MQASKISCGVFRTGCSSVELSAQFYRSLGHQSAHFHLNCSHRILFCICRCLHIVPHFRCQTQPMRTTPWSQESLAAMSKYLSRIRTEILYRQKKGKKSPPSQFFLYSIWSTRARTPDWWNKVSPAGYGLASPCVFQMAPGTWCNQAPTGECECVSGLASPPLAQQQMTRWEVSMTSQRSRKVSITTGVGSKNPAGGSELSEDSCVLRD